MNQNITKNTHFNPCFWTAFWNRNYYNAAVMGNEHKYTARKQEINTLNFRADKIFPTKMEKVHCQKNLGVAEISRSDYLSFLKKYFPEEFKYYSNNVFEIPKKAKLDFENHFSQLEKTSSYTTLIDVVKNGDIIAFEEKTEISIFIVIHQIRNHAVLNSIVEFNKELGDPKFVSLFLLKHFLANAKMLMNPVSEIVYAKWRLFMCDDHELPLNDSPILTSKESIMVPLSPRLLLEIVLAEKSADLQISRERITRSKYKEFEKRLIGNTFYEIISEDQEVLEKIKSSNYYKQRRKVLDTKELNKMLLKSDREELWHINSLAGRLE